MVFWPCHHLDRNSPRAGSPSVAVCGPRHEADALNPVAPGRPWENDCIESFNGRFRDEFLEVEEFESVPDAKEKGE